MGNSLLDVIVFGRDAGKAAAAKAKDVTLGKMNLDHVEKYAETLKEAGIDTGMVSPAASAGLCRKETPVKCSNHEKRGPGQKYCPLDTLSVLKIHWMIGMIK